ncbi:unnamed protein product [Arctia plantaginis]|uniref:RNA 3'-terminal phosphate cyclase n=1 Tax=Arctia plantaginis TaxID=874455 RepID=A0A8S1BLZ2_ARCPL|nr:unnamed protein product [Arctia plantaginis]
MSEFLEIDGSILEGGGQILRISISLSAILCVPIRIINIRAKRSKPGLAAQHLVGIKLVADMCGAKLTGADMGSMEITFIPGRKIRQGHYVADTRTAGSITLLLQVALPCALMADGPVTLDLKGGTNAEMAPQIDYFTGVFMTTLMKFGVNVDVKVHRRGYYPKGGGHVTVQVEPVQKFQAVKLIERGKLVKVYGWSFVAGTLPIKLAHEMADGVKEIISPVHESIDIQIYKENSKTAPDNCSGIIVACESERGCALGADALGRRGAAPDHVGRQAGLALRELIECGACVDNYAQDQMIIYMALAEGESILKCANITLHTETAIHIAQMISKAKFVMYDDPDETWTGEQNIMHCLGMRHTNRHFPSEYWEEKQRET